MKLGIIGYANNSGLGCIIQNFIKHLRIDCQLVIPSPYKGTELPLAAKEYVIHTEMNDVSKFINICKPDVCIFIETPFQPRILQMMHDAGIKIIYIPMVDQIGSRRLKEWDGWVDKWICPNQFSFDELTKAGLTNIIKLPIPIDTTIFTFRQRCKGHRVKTFLHVAGFGMWGQRKNTTKTLEAFDRLRTHPMHPSLILHSILKIQPDKFSSNCAVRHGHPMANPNNLYEFGDVYLAPSIKEGYGLSNYEAMACGLPVMTTDAPPMNELIIDSHLTIPVKQTKYDLKLYDTPICDVSILDLCDAILRIMSIKPNYMNMLSIKSRDKIEKEFSWTVLKQQWFDVCRG